MPVQPPKYTTPAPQKRVATEEEAVPSAEEVLSAGAVDLAKLDQRLSEYSYVAGYLPGKADLRYTHDLT